MAERVMVSIICNAYNHGKYIKEALDSFVMQETEFTYEILVHDDASTDNTADIIKEYETKYPNIVKPIYQRENQYSKDKSFFEKYQFSRVKGKYIAFCEGDDYWTDRYKLQKQFEAMEEHPEVDMCAHAAYKVSDGKIIGKVAPKDHYCTISANEVILGGGGFIATNSLFYRAELRKKKPEFVKQLPLDYFVQIWGSLRGGLLYIPEYMSCYRVAVPGSWTSQIRTNKNARIAHIKNVNRVLEILNEETNGLYENAIRLHIAKNSVGIFEMEKKYSEIKKGDCKTIYDELPIKRKIMINVKDILQKLGFRI